MAARTLKKATTVSNMAAVQYPLPGTDDMPMPRLMHPSELDYIRVTSVQQFRDCPRQYALTYLAPEGAQIERKSAAANIGTAAHTICEQYLLGIHTGQYDQEKANAAYAIIPTDEQQNVHQYATSLQSLAVTKPLFIEERFRMQILPGMPQISGMMDFVAEIPDGLLILDHKTNRGYESVDIWRTKLQPMLYLYMARRLWPGYDKYKFQIGYINLNLTVQWESDPQDDARVEQILGDVWARMQQYAAAGDWPMTINDNCQWCPLKTICPEYQSASQGLRNSLSEMLAVQKPNAAPPSLYAQLDHIKTVAKIVAAEKDRIEAEIMADVLTHGGVGDYPEASAELEIKETNKANTYASLIAFNQFITDNAILPDSVPFLLDQIFTTKITGLQKVGKDIPAFKPVAEALITKVPADKPSLKFTAKKEVLISEPQSTLPA